MTLQEALTQLAVQVGSTAAELIGYAAEDTLGGYHIEETQRKFPQGSLWGVEGQILYALVRHCKPKIIAEIGGWAGASAAHLALAVQRNGVGHIHSIDNGVGGAAHGSLLPATLQPYVTLVRANGEDWLAGVPDQSLDLVFEDASHATDLVALLARLALQKLVPGGVLVNHDAAHDFAIVGGGSRIGSEVGREVRAGLALARVNFQLYLAEPSDCGLAVTVV